MTLITHTPEQWAEWKEQRLSVLQNDLGACFARTMPRDSGVLESRDHPEKGNVFKCPTGEVFADFDRRLAILRDIYGQEAVQICWNTGSVNVKQVFPRLVVPYGELRRQPIDPDRIDWGKVRKAAEKYIDNLIVTLKKIENKGGLNAVEGALFRAGLLRL